MSTEARDADSVQAVVTELANLVGIAIPDEDGPLVAAALRNHAQLAAELLEADLTDITPATRFDPRWHD